MENEEKKSYCGPEGHKMCHCAKHIVLALLALVIIVYVGVLTRNALRTYDYIGKTPDTVDRITVAGTGKVTAAPDVAVLNIGVISDASAVNAATKDNTDKMNRIIDAVKNQFKIAAKDIQTSGYNVSPKYDWTDGRQRIVGYTVSQSVTVKVRDFTKTGDLIGQATELGANSVSGPQFSIDDPEKSKQEARAIAIKQAKDKAKTLADQVGIKLGRIVSFSEGSRDSYPIPMYAKADGLVQTLEAGAPAPVIESGSQDVQIDISISYEIK